MLRIDHCAIDVDAFDPESGIALLTMKGGCPDCDVSPVTFMQGIEVQLRRRVAELKAVKASVASSQ